MSFLGFGGFSSNTKNTMDNGVLPSNYHIAVVKTTLTVVTFAVAFVIIKFLKAQQSTTHSTSQSSSTISSHLLRTICKWNYDIFKPISRFINTRFQGSSIILSHVLQTFSKWNRGISRPISRFLKTRFLGNWNPVTRFLNTHIPKTSSLMSRILTNTRISDTRNADLETVFLLVGKTGSGKSSTANAILGREEFQVTDGSPSFLQNQSQQSMISSGSSRRECGRVLTVVDGPSLFGTGFPNNTSVGVNRLVGQMGNSVLMCGDGLDALLLVFRYPTKFTNEDQQTVAMLKTVLGSTVVRDRCILVFTHGEDFDATYKGCISFPCWLRQQRGELGVLMEECEHRAVLLYNASPEKNWKQLKELLDLADSVKRSKGRCGGEIFQQALRRQEELILIARAPELRHNNVQRMNIIIHQLAKLMQKNRSNDNQTVSGRLEDLKLLKSDVQLLCNDLTPPDGSHSTGVLEYLQKQLSVISQNIEDHENSLDQREKSEHGETIVISDNILKKYEQSILKLRSTKAFCLDNMCAALTAFFEYIVEDVYNPCAMFANAKLVKIK